MRHPVLYTIVRHRVIICVDCMELQLKLMEPNLKRPSLIRFTSKLRISQTNSTTFNVHLKNSKVSIYRNRYSTIDLFSAISAFSVNQICKISLAMWPQHVRVLNVSNIPLFWIVQATDIIPKKHNFMVQIFPDTDLFRKILNIDYFLFMS